MRPFRELTLRFSIIEKCWSQETKSWETSDQAILRLVAALWSGDFDDLTKTFPDRLVLLRVLHGLRQRRDGILFLTPDENAPAIVLPPGEDCLVDLPPTLVHVPSHQPDAWTTDSCGPAFAQLAAECDPGAPLPWYLKDPDVRPILNDIEVRYCEFHHWIARNRWTQSFWEPLANDTKGSAPNAKRGRATKRLNAEEALKAIYPHGHSGDLLKTTADKVNKLLLEQGKPRVSDDTVSRALASYKVDPQKPQN